MFKKLTAVTFALFLSHAAIAAPPKVVTSIMPVHALVLAVMGEIGAPTLLFDATTSPHALALKPSHARALENADVVFWIGPDLETALSEPLNVLADKAQVVALMDAPGLNLLHADFGADHAHGSVDPHIWLSPDNAMAMTDYIRNALTRANPGNAKLFARNAKRLKNRIKMLQKKMTDLLSHTKDVPYIVQHDGYGYLARAFGMNQVGHLQLTPGREAGAKHLSEARAMIKDKGVVCLFTDAQFASAQATQLAKELGLRLGELDPLGSGLDISDSLYMRIIQQLALSLDQCLYTKPKDPQLKDTQPKEAQK